jgi:hypothetical protein
MVLSRKYQFFNKRGINALFHAIAEGVAPSLARKMAQERTLGVTVNIRERAERVRKTDSHACMEHLVALTTPCQALAISSLGE